MSRIVTRRMAESLLDRFYRCAAVHPDLGHGAIRVDTAEWPIVLWGNNTDPGLTVQGAAAEFRLDERMPIPLAPHWLLIKGKLYQGFFLLWVWDWSLVDSAERAVQQIRTLNEEAASYFNAPEAQITSAISTDLPTGINEVDSWMGRVYEVVSHNSRVAGDVETIFLPGNVCAAVARVVEQLAAPILPANNAATQNDGVGIPAVKPASPTRGYCLISPTTVRWDGEIEVQQRLWHLLGVLLDHPDGRVSFSDVEDTLYPGKDRSQKRVQNDVSALNHDLEVIKWPTAYHTKGAYVTFEVPHPPLKPRDKSAN